MDKIDKVINALLSTTFDNLKDFKYEDGRLTFTYGGGKFIGLKSISADLKTEYLTFYHATPFEEAGD